MRLTSLMSLAEALRPFGEDDVARLRADFLLLMKNVERLRSYQEALHFRGAFLTWRTHARETIAHLVAALPDVIAASQEPFKDEAVERWTKEIQVGTWDLISTESPPVESQDVEAAKWRGTGLPPPSPETLYARFVERRSKWADKAKGNARKAWTTLKKYLEWVAGRGGRAAIHPPARAELRIAGIPVTILGDPQELDLFKAGFEHYRKGAARVFPWALQRQLPVVLDFVHHDAAAGRYHGPYITMFPASFSKEEVAHTLAHEMGHHVWKSYLPGAAQTFWAAAVRHDRKPLDLKRVLALWPAGKHNYSLFDLEDYLRIHDPIMFLQVQCLIYGHGPHEGFRFSYDALEDMIARGIKSVPVPANPITAYAEKNPEEAFCDAFGHLVAYGPRSLLPLVRSWVQVVLPSARVERKELPLPSLRG